MRGVDFCMLFHVKLWTKQTHKRQRNSDKKAENFAHYVLHRFFLPRAFVLFTLFFLRACCNVPGIVYAPLRLVSDNDSRQPLRTLKEKHRAAHAWTMPNVARKRHMTALRKSLTGYERTATWQISLLDPAELSSSVYIFCRDTAKENPSIL